MFKDTLRERRVPQVPVLGTWVLGLTLNLMLNLESTIESENKPGAPGSGVRNLGLGVWICWLVVTVHREQCGLPMVISPTAPWPLCRMTD